MVWFFATAVVSLCGVRSLSKSSKRILSRRSVSDLKKILNRNPGQQELTTGKGSKVVNERQFWMNRDGEHDTLKEVLGDSALNWVKQQGATCTAALGEPTESPLYPKILSILDSKAKIPYLTKIDDHYYNFWQDAEHPRGIWRRTTLASYRAAASTAESSEISGDTIPEAEWETVLDFDQLGKDEGESWVYKVGTA